MRPVSSSRLLSALALALGLLGLVGCEQPSEASRREVAERVEVEELTPLVLSDEARLPEREGHLVRVEVYDDHLVFHYDAPPSSPLAVDAVVAGVEGGGYLRRITAITSDGGNVWTAQTDHAELGDLIQEGHFRARMEPGTNSFQAVDGASVDGLDWSGPEIPVGACTVAAGGTVEVRPALGANVGMDIDMDFRVCRRGWHIGGCLRSAHFIAEGSVTAGAEVTTDRNVTVSCERDLIPEATANRLARKWTTTFMVGPVPVIITHTLAPTATASISGTIGTGDTTLSASGRVAIRAGAEYRGGSWQRVWEPSASGSASVTTQECGDLTLSAEIASGIEYKLKIYDAAGPEIAYGPSVSGEFSADFGATEWTAEVRAGLSGSIGASLEVPVIDVTLASISWDLPEANLFSRAYQGALRLCLDAGQASPDAGASSGADAAVFAPSGRDGGASARDAGIQDGGYCQPLRAGCGASAPCCNSDVDPSVQCIAGRCDDVDTCRGWDDACSPGTTAPDRCCGGLQCARQSAGAALSCCVAAAGVCRTASDCCGDMPCTDGRCVARPSGGRCFSTFECGGSDVCRTDGTCGRPG